MADPSAPTDPATPEAMRKMYQARDRERGMPPPVADLLSPDIEREEHPVPEHAYDPGAVQRGDTCREHGGVCGRIEHAITLAETNEKTSLRIEGRINDIFHLLGGAPSKASAPTKPLDIKTVGVIVGGIAVALLSILSAYWSSTKETHAENGLQAEIKALAADVRALKQPPVK